MNPDEYKSYNPYSHDPYEDEYDEPYGAKNPIRDKIKSYMDNDKDWALARVRAARAITDHVLSSTDPEPPYSMAKDEATMKISRALAIHQKTPDPRQGKDSYCSFCSSSYPCITVQALTDPI